MSTAPAVSPEPSNLTDRAYYAIRDRMLRGQLRLGAPLSSRRLAEELGMSHLPVSQALRRLENEGLVESRPRAGTRVRVPTEADIRQQYEVREALECQSARLFATRATAEQRQEMQRMARHLDGLFDTFAAGQTDSEFIYEVHSYHFRFHMRLAEYADCEALRQLIEKNQILTFNWVYDVAANRRTLPERFHQDLVDVLAGDDPEAADRAMRYHVRYGLDERIRNLDTEIRVEWRLRRTSEEAE